MRLVSLERFVSAVEDSAVAISDSREQDVNTTLSRLPDRTGERDESNSFTLKIGDVAHYAVRFCQYNFIDRRLLGIKVQPCF